LGNTADGGMNALQADVEHRQGAFSLRACFTAPGDAITVLFGPSGSGKSTLLSLLAGLKRPDKGRIALGGIAMEGLPPHRRGIGLVFQDARLFPHLTVRQNIAYARARAPKDALDIETAAGFFDIAALLDRPVVNLSIGEKSRVALARALVSRPDFLLLDEPFAALDGLRRRAFIAVLLQMHRVYRLPMLVVTHNIDDAAALASHLIALKDGAIVASGDLADASRTPEFQSLLDARDIGAAVPAALLQTSHGEDARAIWLRADQVLLAGERPRAISARNVLPGQVRAIAAEGENSVLVELLTDAGMILSRVTPTAARDLGLAPGLQAWALVKAHAL
jgi:molybdate transport system ATP-binding protein